MSPCRRRRAPAALDPDKQEWPTLRWPDAAEVIGEVKWAARDRVVAHELSVARLAHPFDGQPVVGAHDEAFRYPNRFASAEA